MKSFIKIVTFFCLAFFNVLSLSAATYYIKWDGNDLADGLSDATAWKSLNMVNQKAFKVGDDVYFKCGGKYVYTPNGLIGIDWSGASNNRVIIGSYYMKGGVETIGVNNDGKPILDGKHQAPVGTHPSNREYYGLIHIDNQTYITIENLRIINSEGEGVKASESTYINISNIEVDNTYFQGISISKCLDSNIIIEGCSVHNADMVFPEYKSYSPWPAALSVINSSYVKIRNNKVFENYGEGIMSNSLSSTYPTDYNTIEDNLVFGNRAAQIYICNSAHNTIRRNLVYGTINQKYHRFPGYNGPGLWVSDESWTIALSQDNHFYNNFVANCDSGIQIEVGLSGAVFKDSVFYNNTIVDCDKLVTIYGNNFKNSYIRNNIFSFINHKSTVYKGPVNTYGLTWEYNLWPEAVTASRISSTNVYGVPALSRMSGWNTLVADGLSVKDFALTSKANSLINKGKDLGDSYKVAVNSSTAQYPSAISLIERPKGAWDIGADELSFLELEPPFLSIK